MWCWAVTLCALVMLRFATERSGAALSSVEMYFAAALLSAAALPVTRSMASSLAQSLNPGDAMQALRSRDADYAQDALVIRHPALQGWAQDAALAEPAHDLPAALEQMRILGEAPAVVPPRATIWSRAAKRAFDIVMALMLLTVLLPLFALVSVAILVSSGRPIFFRQDRTGAGGKPFAIWKFRTMSACENGQTVHQATRNDARTTAIGALLRRTSIDELPQLFNVVKGDMSLVGPRPHALAHDRYYIPLIASYGTRYLVKPGITGWAQVNGARGATPMVADMERRVSLDLWYIENWSLALDLKILARTGPALLSMDAF